jgi:hypothetical protein
VVVVGDSQRSSAEGIDRAELSLPGTHQLALVQAIHKVTQVSQNGYVLSRRGHSVSVHASGIDTHCDSITSRLDLCHPRGDAGPRRQTDGGGLCVRQAGCRALDQGQRGGGGARLASRASSRHRGGGNTRPCLAALYPATRVLLRVIKPVAWLIRCALTNDHAMSCVRYDAPVAANSVRYRQPVRACGGVNACLECGLACLLLVQVFGGTEWMVRYQRWLIVNLVELWCVAPRCAMQLLLAQPCDALRLLARARSFVHHVRVLQSRDTQCCSGEGSLRRDRAH